MNLLNKFFSCLWRYILGIVIAIICYAILSLVYKLALITVQGPTLFSQLSLVTVYYVTLSASYFFLFHHYGRKRPSVNLTELLMYLCVIVGLHLIIALNASFSTLWLISIGASDLTSLLYNRIYSSFREIPRAYYLLVLLIEDICFVVFALWGNFKGLKVNNK